MCKRESYWKRCRVYVKLFKKASEKLLRFWLHHCRVNAAFVQLFFMEFNAPIRIFEADHRSQKAESTNIFKAFFTFICRIIYSYDTIQFDIYSKPEFHFWKWIPLIGDSCERGFFNLRGGGGNFFDILQKYIFNVWSSTAFLFWQSCNCCTIAYTQHKPDFMTGCEAVFYTRFTHTPFGVRMSGT